MKNEKEGKIRTNSEQGSGDKKGRPIPRDKGRGRRKLEEPRRIRFIDPFGGAGGFRAGLERANDISTKQLPAQSRGWNSNEKEIPNGHSSITPSEGGTNTGEFRCVAYYEIDKYCVQTYNKNFGESHEPTDIRTVDAKDIPDHDLLCAGFPCQPFSTAGKRKGFQDIRGTLFYELVRIAEEKKPEKLLLENVDGLLSAGIQIGTGYYTANKGKPQGEITSDRKRVEEEPERKWEEIAFNVCSGAVYTQILLSLQELGHRVEWEVLNSKNFGVPQNRERVFIVGHLGGIPGREVFPLGQCDKEPNEMEREAGNGGQGMENEVASAIDSNYWKGGRAGRSMIEVQPLRFLNRNQKNFNNTAMTVDTSHSTGLKVNQRIRRLTPLECERLQGFPDGWTEGVSDTQRYRQMGNAVTVNVVEAIARAMKGALQ